MLREGPYQWHSTPAEGAQPGPMMTKAKAANTHSSVTPFKYVKVTNFSRAVLDKKNLERQDNSIWCMSWIRKVKKRSREDLTGKLIVFINSHAEFHHGYIRHSLYSWEFYLGNFRTERSRCLQLRNGLRQYDVSKSLYGRRRGRVRDKRRESRCFRVFINWWIRVKIRQE